MIIFLRFSLFRHMKSYTSIPKKWCEAKKKSATQNTAFHRHIVPTCSSFMLLTLFELRNRLRLSHTTQHTTASICACSLYSGNHWRWLFNCFENHRNRTQMQMQSRFLYGVCRWFNLHESQSWLFCGGVLESMWIDVFSLHVDDTFW